MAGGTDREVRQLMIGEVIKTRKKNGLEPSVREAEKFLSNVSKIPRPLQDHSKAPVVKPTLQESFTANLPEGQRRATVLRGRDVTEAKRRVSQKVGKRPRLLSDKEQVMKGTKALLFARRLRLLVSMQIDPLTKKAEFKYPDWEAKLREAYNEGHRVAWREGFGTFDEMVNIAIERVVTMSNDTFGRWDRPPGKKLVFSG